VRKTFAILLAFVLVFGIIAGCNKDNSSETVNTPATTSPPTNTDGGGPTEATPIPGGQSGAGATPSPGKHFADEIQILNDGNIVAVIDPFIIGGGGNGPGSWWASKMMHDRLIQATPPEQEGYDPGLAVEWSTEDYIHFKFKLREGVVFQNGEPFTADDVIWTCEYAKTRTASPALTGVWTYVETINKIDDYNIEIVAKDEIVNPDLYINLSSQFAPIVNKKAITDDPETGHYIGTGPYRLTEFVSQNYWTLERFDGFWGEPAITRKLSWRHIPEIANRTTMLLNGEAQLCMAVSTEDMELFEDNPDFTIFTRVLNNANPISFNMTKPITSDINFRLAVLHAIDKEEYAIAYKGKYCLPGTDIGGIWARYAPYRNTELESIQQDIELAKEYLAKSVYNGETLELAAVTVGHQAAVPVFQQWLEAIGIHTQIKLLQMAETPEYIANNSTEMLLITAPLNFMPSNIRNWLLPGAPSNSAQYDNPEVTKLINDAMVEPDDATREAMWKEVQRLVYEDHSYEHLVWFMETVVGEKGVGGFVWDDDCYYNMRYIYYEVDD
jgi:peptide/nickel transport system substrate-binding protein